MTLRLPSALVGLLAWPLLAAPAMAEVQRVKVSGPAGYLIVEALDDDLMHFEVSAAGAGPGTDAALYTSPMVANVA